MSLHNLATVFGPTLLRPAAKDNEPVTLEMFSAQAQDAMTQTGILLHYLNITMQHNMQNSDPQQS